MNLKNVVTFILDVEAHEYQHTNRREPSHPDCATASHLLSVSDAKKVMKKLLTDSLCLLTKTQPYQRQGQLRSPGVLRWIENRDSEGVAGA